MAFNYKKYKAAQFISPILNSSPNKAGKLLKGLKTVGRAFTLPALIIEEAAFGAADLMLTGWKAMGTGPARGGSGGGGKETVKEKETRESKEGKVVKGGTQRFLGTVD